MSQPLRKTLLSLMRASEFEHGRAMEVRLEHGLHIAIRVHHDNTHLLIWRENTWPGDTEWKTVVDSLPYPPDPYPFARRVQRKQGFCLYSKWPTLKRVPETRSDI